MPLKKNLFFYGEYKGNMITTWVNMSDGNDLDCEILRTEKK